MRKVTETIAESFYKGFKKTVSNTHTDGVNVWLHGNKIAWRNQDNSLSVTLAGWGTPTTRERINGILETFGIHYRVGQHKHEQIIKTYDNYSFESLPYGDDTVITFFSDDVHLNGYKFSE